MGVPDDCNPLNRRVPAEVVSRRHRPEKQVPEADAPLETERAQVLLLKPEHRVKWLVKAFTKNQEGKVTITVLYDIISHTKFGVGASDKVGRHMFKIVRSNLSLFSQKQQRYLEGESKLAKDFRYRGRAPEAGATGSSANAPDGEAETGDGMGADDIPALWGRLSSLSPAQCEEAIDALEPNTRTLLEDFLEGRISAKAGVPPASGSANKSSRSRSRSPKSKKAKKAKDAEGKSKKGKAESSDSSSGNSSSSSSQSSRHRRRSRSRGKSRRDKK